MAKLLKIYFDNLMVHVRSLGVTDAAFNIGFDQFKVEFQQVGFDPWINELKTPNNPLATAKMTFMLVTQLTLYRGNTLTNKVV